MARVTLSFDNGPDLEGTPRVLDALAARGLRTTFFAVGRRLERPGARALLERARREGHWIGNHSYSHGTPLGRDPSFEAAAREIDGAQALLGELVHEDLPFRPFGGGGRLDRNLLSRAALARLVAGRHTLVLWSCVPGDWVDAGWIDRALTEIGGRREALVVLHDTVADTAARLPEFLDVLETAGHEIAQAWPEDCVPIRRGAVRRPLDAWIAD
ncbi:MAG TPA: polysaccharide deacetylase family protein [Myxococcota bacterium]|nr:polysaccharide deacetylase family protein [Myxococcota bacterium]